MRSCLAVAAAVALSGSLAWADQGGTLDYPYSFFADARPSTAYDMITRLPGFVFDDGATARGFAGTAGNVLIDGQRPTAKTDDLQSILQRISASDVERIEVIRGGAQGIDMHGQTVVANVVRKKVDTTQVVVDVDNNIWPTGHMVPSARIQLTHRSGDSTYEASLRQIGSYNDSVGKGFYNVTDVATGAVQHADTQRKGMGIGWGLTGAATVPLWGGQFKANIAYSDSPYRAETLYWSAAKNWRYRDTTGDRNGELGLHWIGDVGGAELETLALQRLGRKTDNQRNGKNGDEFFSSKSKTSESILRTLLRYRLDDDLTLESGAEGAYNLLDGSSSYALNGVAVPVPSGNARVDETRGELFAQAMWNFLPEWKLEAGARFEYSTIGETGYTKMSRSFFYPKPRVLLSWTPVKDTQLRLRYERVLGQLDFSNFVASSNFLAYGVNAGNPNLAPDRHSQYEISIEQDFWERGAIVLTLLHEDITGVLDYIPVKGASGVFDAPGNIGPGHKNIIDTQLTLPLDSLGIPNGLLKVVNTWRFTGVRDPVTGTARTISGIRPQKVEVTFKQDIESLNSTWGVYLFNGWDESYYRLTQVRHSRVPPLYMDLNWDYKPTPDWMFSVTWKNINRFSYDDVNYYAAGPRNLYDAATISELKIRSQTRLYIEIRKTF